MPEIGTSGSMSGDGKRSVAAWPKRPRPSSTLPYRTCRVKLAMSALRAEADMPRPPAPYQSDANDPERSFAAYFAGDAMRFFSLPIW
jgi:hypothetical protein